ncbi:MAG: hypothetical protein JXB88_23295 [Spirochaetales bacterium]|nr:hypothetical protein [Spirochaetales bacterium]
MNDKIIVSEDILKEGLYELYLVPHDNPDVEYRIKGGFSSIDEAKKEGKELFEHMMKEEIEIKSIEYKKRGEIILNSSVLGTKEDVLIKSFQNHLKTLFSIGSGFKTIKDFFIMVRKSLFSIKNIINIIIILAIILFWTKIQFIIPEDLELPLIGDMLKGMLINANSYAIIFPLLLLLSYFIYYLWMKKKVYISVYSVIRYWLLYFFISGNYKIFFHYCKVN